MAVETVQDDKPKFVRIKDDDPLRNEIKELLGGEIMFDPKQEIKGDVFMPADWPEDRFSLKPLMIVPQGTDPKTFDIKDSWRTLKLKVNNAPEPHDPPFYTVALDEQGGLVMGAAPDVKEVMEVEALRGVVNFHRDELNPLTGKYSMSASERNDPNFMSVFRQNQARS